MLLVDGHVHVHECFDVARFLDAAADNFGAVAAGLGGTLDPQGILMLTEAKGARVFESWSSRAPVSHGSWRIDRTSETDALVAQRGREDRLLLVAGRQIVTAERLEVLALATTAPFVEGRPLRAALDDVREAGGLPVLPWGFGKWSFSRGELVRRVVAEEDPGSFFLGDNGGRPGWGRRPPEFAMAERRAIRILPGSDPLPLACHVRRAGSFGFALERPENVDRPASWLRERLASPSARPVPYGRGEKLLPFLRNQVLMQARKRGIA
jgi:hypothetical protein